MKNRWKTKHRLATMRIAMYMQPRFALYPNQKLDVSLLMAYRNPRK